MTCIDKNGLFFYSEKIKEEQNKPVPKTKFCSTTQRDFYVQGFVPESIQGTANTVRIIVHYALMILNIFANEIFSILFLDILLCLYIFLRFAHMVNFTGIT